MRTGNTPVHMAFSTDLHYLIVGNDNSQIATVLDLNVLQPVSPILFPFGHYPRAIGVANGAMFAIARNAGTPNPCAGRGAARIRGPDYIFRTYFQHCHNPMHSKRDNQSVHLHE